MQAFLVTIQAGNYIFSVVSYFCTFFPKPVIFITFQSWSIQAGEFFHSAQSIAAAQNHEFEANVMGEVSIDSPLLLEQVILSDLTLYSFLKLRHSVICQNFLSRKYILIVKLNID